MIKSATCSILIFFVSAFVDAQVFIPYSFWRGNQGPTISAIANQNVYEGNITTIPFPINHKSGYPLYCSSVSLSATTSNAAAVPLSAISFVGTFPFCYINVTTPAGAIGASTITVIVSDIGNPLLQATSPFTATVYTVQGLTVSPNSQIIPQSSTFQFLAMASYSDGTTQNIASTSTWGLVLQTGSAPAGLSQSLGLITVGVVTGYPTYNYTATYGAYSSTAGISFNPSTINGLIVTPVSGNINIGGSVDIKCYATTVDGGVFDSTNNCTWTSNNNPVANVNNLFFKGRVYGNSLGGPVTITATYAGFTDTSVITVDALTPTTVDEGVGLYGRYYSTISTTGPKNDPYSALVNARIDSQVNYNWAAASNPAGGLDDFGARWTGQITAPTSGIYCIQTLSDDGVRLWIGNSIVINDWTDHGPTTDTGAYTFIAGIKAEIFLEFYERAGGAEVHLKYVAGACGTSVAVPRINLFPIATRALDIQQNVVPQWGNLRRGFDMNGAVGPIANGAAITGFTNGAATPVNAVASNANGTGMAYAANSERSQSIAFDGVDDSISVAASTIPTTNGVRTVAVWVNPTNIGATQDVFGWGTAAANSSFGMSLLANGTVRVYGGGGSNCDTAAGALSFATWTHITTTFNGTTALIYINGLLSKTCGALAWSTPAGSTLYIGAGSTLVNRFSGYIDDIGFWNIVLNSGEVNSLYQKQKVFNP